ncbi:cytochrome P450 monooxygenase [Lophiotrema nucula]|uniref:Cytochrome P450 monooxygenase n=1 Tax=Lophiotrema nucula TaxID=690887 RepID=A0A6A5ZJ48_9PLEO|nr:cytochrome P450 monooxygenase [Lophiotrema nucula]
MENKNITMELPASGFQSFVEQAPILSTFLRPSSILLSVIVLFFTTSGLRKLFSGGRKGSPSELIGRPGDRDFHNALLEGYKKHPHSLFTIPTGHHPMTIIPTESLDEIKALPENILSFQKQVTARFLGKYTGLGVNDTLVHSVKVDLTKNIPRILGELEDEVGYSIGKHIGESQDWTPHPLYYMLTHLVALLSGRIFVGHPLSRDPTWLHATVRYTIDGFVGAEKLWMYPSILHPIMQYFIPEVRQVHSYLSNGAKMLGPIINDRQGKQVKKGDRTDMIQWIIDNSDPKDKGNVDYVTKTQMLISVVAIHTTTMTMSQTIFDLLAHPEYIDILREEIKSVKPTDEEPWTKSKIAGLRKMDSFMKESQRFRPPGLVTMNRQVEQPIELKNGLVLPKGAHIGVAAGSNALDPALFPHPEEFDGLRFLKLRDQPGNENMYQFVTTGPDQLHWGVGTHACPGRFFASYEIKMLLSKILMDYDIKLADGATQRPADIAIDIRVVPNPQAQVAFKKREVPW